MTAVRIVIVTYNWPPRNAIGTHRPYAWAKHWSEAGAAVTVLTAQKASFDQPLDLALPELPGVSVMEVPFVRAGVQRLTGGTGTRAHLKRLKKLASRYAGISVDVRARWVGAAKHEASRLATDADVVVSTYEPAAAHRLAHHMKRVNPRIRWVADYRDLWTLNHRSVTPKWAKACERRRELALVARRADAVTTVSQELANQLSDFMRRPVAVVMNGFDVSQSTLLARLNRCRQRICDGPLRIVYTGRIYPGWQDPSPLLDAIRNLSCSGRLQPGELELLFYGPVDHGLRHMITERDIDAFVRVMGHAPRNEILTIQQDADFCVLLESDKPEAKGVLTGKLFEYMASGTPIISLGSPPDSAIAQVLLQTGAGRCFGNDVASLELALGSAVSGETPTWYQPKPDHILKYSRKEQSRIMMDNVIQPMMSRL